MSRRWVLELPALEPLSLNDRRHPMQRHSLSKRWKKSAWVCALDAQVPPLAFARVRLHYLAPDRRRRDADNLAATSKPVVDGLRDAGVIPDDDTEHIDHLMPAIHAPTEDGPSGPRWWLVIDELDQAPVSAQLTVLDLLAAA